MAIKRKKRVFTPFAIGISIGLDVDDDDEDGFRIRNVGSSR